MTLFQSEYRYIGCILWISDGNPVLSITERKLCYHLYIFIMDVSTSTVKRE